MERRRSSPLVQGVNGNLYGATFYGGSSDDGTVYEITPSGTLTSLHSFCSQTGCTGGGNPGELILGRDGNFYGVTMIGGANSDPNDCPFGCGTVFKSTPGGSVTTLYNFCAQERLRRRFYAQWFSCRGQMVTSTEPLIP